VTAEAYLYDAVRTPFGRYGGALAHVRPDDLAAGVVQAVVDRSPELDPARIDEVVLGNANGAGEDNRNVARMATLLAGLPVTIPGSSVNRLCGSSLDAAMIASRQIETGDADLVLAGGVESMSRAPWVVLKPERGYVATSQTLHSTTLGWRMVNPAMPEQWTVSLGEANEQLADELGIDRERMDHFAAGSHQRAARAWADGFYEPLVVGIDGVDLARDEAVRPDSSTQSLGRLRASFRPEGRITAGNASPLNDGASAVLMGSASAERLLGRTPVARVAGRGAHALEPHRFGVAPVEAANQALDRAGLSWHDIGLVELNEAFAVQSLACIDAWGIDPDIVNTRGGAIAIGHPLGASGTRILGTLAEAMRVDGVRYGVAAICIGVGQGLAVVLENVTRTW
jgi:acetyl-CoA acyltransferase